ncbi:MAG: AMP-binding protein, partial [Clostridiales bacterium]|nr:AMP-binding protein [Clostridiales bacterium]
MLEYRDIVKSLYSARKENKGVTIIKSQDEEKYISYDSLWKASSLVCEHLRKSGAQKNSEVIIQCKNTEYYMYAFWACAIGGFIAVPIDVSNNDYMTASNKKIIELMDCPFLLYDDVNNITADTDTFAGKSINVSGIDYTVDTEIDNNYDDAFHHQDDIMYIQFSSGSTGEPKGSVLRRYNISANSQAIIKGLQMDTSDTSISWQPLTHCYGLTFFHLIPIMLNVSHYLIPTDVFLKSPMLWLEKVHEHRITRAGMIPFALRHFMNYYEKSATPEHWDLSCLKSMTLGAEQVKPELCTSFTALMAKHKLGADVPKPGYGLTESTACASVTGMDQTITGHYLKCANMGIGQVVDEKADALAPDTVSFVEIGEPLEGVELRILNDEGSVLPENTIGYLYVKGDNITTGYHKKPKETAALLSADGWLNTGDIGFIKNKRLVVIGRQKEVIVVNGLKYLCNELEDIINKGIINNPFGQIAVCNGLSKERNTEQAVVFVEMELDYAKAKDVSEFLAFSRQIKEIVFVTMELLIDSVLPIDRLPRTKSGKMKRKELGDRYNSGEFLEAMNRLQTAAKKESENVHASVDDSAGLSEKQVLNTILEIIDKLFGFDVSDYDLSFQDHGVMSSDVPFFIDEINRVFDLDISVSAFFGYPNINQLSSFIHKLYKAKSETTSEKPAETIMLTETEKVAIVGMSCRFPGGANSVDEFWELLITQRDGISDVPETRWDLEKYYDADENIPGKMYCKKGGFLNVPINEFDARFFNISPKEALAMDPQQRLLLELIWESFENAGIDIGKCKGKDTGVYLGISSNEYMMAHLNSGELSRIDAYSLTGACASTACGRISYTFGFEGPCIAVDTACSSALSALHIAHQSIKNGETRLAVVGGVNLMLSPSTNVGFSKLHATSPSGQSKAFDASADGYGRSEGAGVLILKSLSDAIRDNDQILGVIRSTSINQDGRSNGLTAPNGMAQERLIGEALRKAGLSATDVDYVEMHGTGTPLGDPIEVNAVANTYGTGRGFDNPLRIGSVKSNVGHMEAAAGIASMIKVLLSFKNNVIPGNLHFNEPNPLIDWPRLNVNVVGEHSEWINKNDTRRAGINGFGFGGSNAHVIIEEYIAPEKAKATEPRQIMNYILKISARCDDSLRRLVEKYYQVIAECDESALSDIILSAARGRADFECRIAVTGSSKEDLLYKLEAYLTGEQPEGLYYSDGSNPVCLKGRQPVFMFTGQGSQYIKMGKPLYESSSVFKDALDECDRLFKPYLLTSIIDLIYSEKASNETIEKTCYAQPLIFSIEYALFKLLTHYGVMPEIVMGHSIGEYAAAVVSGVISLSDAAKLVSARGRLMDMAPGEGGMGTIFAAQSVVETMIENYSGEVTIAACNAKETYVISGKKPLVEQILNDAEAAGYKVNRLKVSHGFHSPLMMPILDNFDSVAKEIQYASPKIRFVSAVHAAEIGKDKALDHTYWTEHIVKRVDFYNAVMSIDKPENYAFIEIGSHRVLSSLLKLIFDSDKTVVGTLNRKKEDGSQMANTIAELYVAGVDIDWEKVCFSTDMGWKRYTLPTYQFERESYWRDLLFDRPVSYTPTDGVSRLLGQKIESPALNGGVIFQSKFTAQEPYFIKEHIIFKMPISPAAAHVSMILSAVNELGKPGTCTLKSIELWTPLAVDVDEQRTVQVCLSNIDNKVETDFSIISKSQTSDDAEWLKHVQGKFTSSERVIDSQITLD